LRPGCTPRAFAGFNPALVRSTIKARSCLRFLVEDNQYTHCARDREYLSGIMRLLVRLRDECI
jgi:hypothetical protein